MDAKDKIVKAKVKLQKDNPFFAYLVMNLDFKEDNEIKSMGVDFKGNCFYNTKWVESLYDSELKGVLSHEVLHLALEHLTRLKKRDKELFNIACDLAINNMLVNNQVSLPRGSLIPHSNSYHIGNNIYIDDLDKKNAEEIYNELLKHSKIEKKQLSNSGFDEHIYSEDDNSNSKEIRESQEKWKKAFSEASVYSQQRGKLPKGIDRFLDEILNQKVSWKSLLYKYLTRVLPYDYTYSRPSKKSLGSGFYLPSVLREDIEVVVSVDTSGSISQETLSEFLNEVIGIAKTFNNIKIKLIVCDCEIQEVYEFSNGDIDKIRNLKVKGGGGTSHLPIYDYIEKNLPNTKIVVNFTDGYTEFPEYEKFKSIWVLTKHSCKDTEIPFGEIIRLD